MVEQTVLGVERIKEELEVEVEDQTFPHSWDSGVVMDTAAVTALQMAEFQQVVDNIQRQVVGQNPQPAPPPYPYKVAPSTASPVDGTFIYLYYPARKRQQRRVGVRLRSNVFYQSRNIQLGNQIIHWPDLPGGWRYQVREHCKGWLSELAGQHRRDFES